MNVPTVGSNLRNPASGAMKGASPGSGIRSRRPGCDELRMRRAVTHLRVWRAVVKHIQT